MLSNITDLAREKSSDKRRELLGRVADLFFDGAENHTEQGTLIFRDIVLKMLNDVSLEGRAEFADRVATETRLPNEVAMQMAQDDVAVAGPVLQHSPVLTDDDFVQLTQTLPASHLESIAQREHLSGTVTDALIENGTRAVWHKVTQNRGAEITSKGFNALVSNADGDAILQSNLAARPDITEDAAKRLLPLLPPEGKARLAQLFKENAEMANALVDGAKKAASEQTISGRQKRLEAKIVIADVRDGRRDKSEALSLLVETNRGPDIVMFLAAMSDLEEPIVSNALYQSNDEPISLLCKSIEISNSAFAKLMGLKADKLNKSLAETGRVVAFYKDLDVASAQRAMRFVSMRKNMSEKQAG
ncbi:DUF2336 domain-containing protein [uncultured Cohaesibacter sp.]|uniref:DUF2336 domain-containing protein n=1 Tax=uncultured Cohaesibacter sp. TaxID=1002546 RepID=UPI0029C7AF6E|nr:DUF2336 domain-containing protein [uncultured Cohaesibacter sp.]